MMDANQTGAGDAQRTQTIGRLCVCGDWACAQGDYAGLREIVQRLAASVGEPLHCELLALADGCRPDAELVFARWARIKDLLHGSVLP
jgi:hypothetical protein